MLAGSVSISPRPRPPARSRRTSTKSSPPPPYRGPSPSGGRPVPGEATSPFTETSRSDWDGLALSARPEQWDERSREELSGLLLKADELIRDREHDLNVTTTACQALYKNNLELKNRHKALLARLSPRKSPSPSHAFFGDQLPQSPHYYSDASRSSSRASLHSPAPRHRRRLSVSQSDLTLLADENAQLLAKLEQLEEESVQADQAGRRKLRILEKEIQGLREELEKTRAKSDEFEAKARAASIDVSQRDEALSRKKREREERIRALRGKSIDDSDGAEVRDFAPGSPFGLMRHSRPRFTPRRHMSQAILHPPLSEDDVMNSKKGPLANALKRSASQPGLFHLPDIPSRMEPPTEYALVAQLLLKIKELEETNAQITEQQARTTAQLQAVQKDADGIRLAYESLGNAENVQWISDDGDGDVESAGSEQEEVDDTVRFSSLRRSLSATGSTDFDPGTEGIVQGSLIQEPSVDFVPATSHFRSRRSVVGLFDSPTSSSQSATPGHHDTPSIHSLTIPGLPPVPFVPQPSTTSSRSPSPTHWDGMSGAMSPTCDVQGYPTLDCELDAALDGNWDSIPGNNHFRTPSLLSLGLTGSQRFGPRDLASSVISISSVIIPAETDKAAGSSGVFTSALQSSQGSTKLRPSVWRGGRMKFETAAERKRRQSETIRMRTNTWTQSRFGGTLLHSGNRRSVDISRPSTPVPQRLANVFDTVVDTIGRSNSESSRSSRGHSPGDDAAGANTDRPADSVRSRSASVTAPPQAPQQRGIVSFVLEVWLWLQFAIIIVVFVWAMAKRGPKSVLEGTGKKAGTKG
ncbi:hypothetical protein ID866_5743 [Astraeus odoratus]|nr:hypothetical protein ID866_5743 [Astraeus odoratus]